MFGGRLIAALRRPAMIAVISIAAIAAFGNVMVDLPGRSLRQDFSNYYASAWAIRHGIDPYTTNLTPVGEELGLETGSMIYAADTPTFLLAMEPLTRLSPTAAFWIWSVLNLAALAAAMYLLLGNRPGIPPRDVWLLAALALMFMPVGYNFFWGQTQVLILFLMVVAMHAMETERDALAGLAIAIAGLLRAYPLLLLGYFLFRRRWRALEYGIFATLAGALITVICLGLQQSLSFVNGANWVIRDSQTSREAVISMGPFVSRILSHLYGQPPNLWIRRLASSAATAFVLYITALVSMRVPARSDPEWRIYSLWIVAAVMLSPLAWHHYLLLLIIPFVQIVAAANLGRTSARALWAAAASYMLSSFSLALFIYFESPPRKELDLRFPWLVSALLETGFLSILAAYFAAYWFAADLVHPETNRPNCEESFHLVERGA
jgi:hypothetical protein